jgi:Xaa-Pro aminopeptidase
MALISYTAFELGAEDMDIHVDTGRHTWTNMCYHSNAMIRPGDLVFLDVYNLSWLGYKSCYYRTFSCGEPTKVITVVYNTQHTVVYSRQGRRMPPAALVDAGT